MKPAAILVFLLFSISCYSQQIKFSGTLIDSETLRPIEDANVVIAGTTKGTTSDLSGYFELTSKPGAVAISHVKYETTNVDLAADNSNVSISLNPANNRIRELRVQGNIVLEKFSYDNELRRTEIQRRSGTGSESEFKIVEAVAEFPGGLEMFHNYLLNEISVHRNSLDRKFQATVKFTIDREGRLNVDAIYDVPVEDYQYINELFSSSPKWIPSYQRFKPVEVSFVEPLVYDPDVAFLGPGK